MSRWRERGALDDVVVPNGDGGFVKFETRRHPTQLEPGTASFAQNQRFDDNVATVRKGIDRISSDVLDEGDPLLLPFSLGEEVSVASITRSGSTATLTLSATPDTPYDDGDEVEVQGADQSEYNSELLTSGTVISAVRYRINNFVSGDDFSNIGGTNETGNIFTASGTTPTTWSNGSTLQRLIDVTYVSDTVYTYPVAGTPATPATGTITASPVIGAATDGVFASTLFSDVETDQEYIALAQLDKVTLVNPDDPTNTTDIFYAEDSILEEQFEQTDDGDIRQVGNGLLIHRGKGKKALEWNGNLFNTSAREVTSMTLSGTTVTVTTAIQHEYRVGDIFTISGANESDYNGDHTVSVVVDDSNFEYEISASPSSPATGTITASLRPQFNVIADTNFPGFLSMPQAEFSEYHPFARLVVPVRVIIIDIDSIERNGGVATVTTGIDHGLIVGDRIEITGAVQGEYNGVQEITDSTSNTFKFLVTGSPATPATGSNLQVKVDVRDQFIVSDIYDHRTYDPVTNLFRINRGTADSLVGLQTFQNDNLLAVYEKSVHVITDISFADLSNSTVFLITDEVGCIARKTIEIIGGNVVFLSEQGVYMLEITPEINLRGKEIPLSKDIQDQFTSSNLNYEVINKAVATYFNNRYYIAVPSNGSTRNDIVYIYNFINGGWESKDTFGSDNFIDNWVVCRKDGKERLFATSLEGSIQLWEELDLDELGSIPTNTEIPGKLITREYTGANATNLTMVNPFASLEVGQYKRASINFTTLASDQVTVSSITRDPDVTKTLASYTFSAGDSLKRPRIKQRGTGCRMQIESAAGRPSIRSISVDSSETQRSNKTFE